MELSGVSEFGPAKIEIFETMAGSSRTPRRWWKNVPTISSKHPLARFAKYMYLKIMGKTQQGFPSLNIMKLQLRLLKRFFYRDRPFSVTLRSCDLWLLTKSDTLMFSVDQRWAEILKAAQRLPRSGTARCAGTACIRRATNSSSCWGIAGQPIWWVNIWNLLVCGCLFPKILS